jgi:hypothetical protein
MERHTTKSWVIPAFLGKRKAIMKLPQEQHDNLLSLGFTHDDEDPEFPYCYDLMEDEVDDEEKLQLLVNASPAVDEVFSLSVAGIGFINLNIHDPEKAIEWAKEVSSYTPN